MRRMRLSSRKAGRLRRRAEKKLILFGYFARVLIRFVSQLHESNRSDVLHSYVKVRPMAY